MITGSIDLVTSTAILGWALPASGEAAAILTVEVDGEGATTVVADRFRPDLAQAGIGSGHHGFEITLRDLAPFRLSRISILRSDGSAVPGSPIVLRQPGGFGDDMRTGLAVALSTVEQPSELLPRATFLAQLADRLLQQYAGDDELQPSTIDRSIFQARWTGRTTGTYAPQTLVITPHALGADAASRAVLSHVRSLRRLGQAIVVAPADMIETQPLSDLSRDGIVCCTSPWCGSVEEILRRRPDGFPLVYLRDSAAAYLPLVRLHQPGARIVLGFTSLPWAHMPSQDGSAESDALLARMKAARSRDMGFARAADIVLVHAEPEAAALQHGLAGPRVHVVPWSVSSPKPALPFPRRSGVALLGTCADPQVLDAAWWMVQIVLPHLRMHRPSAECVLAGPDVPPSLREAGKGVLRVIEEPGQWLDAVAKTRATVALPNSDGTAPAELLDTVAAGLPCACTPAIGSALGWSGAALEATVARDRVADLLTVLVADEDRNRRHAEAQQSQLGPRLTEPQLDGLLAGALGG